jgi:hypothetical protein
MLSILAEDKIQILLTKQKNWQHKPGIIINLQSFGYNWIASCLHNTTVLADSGCSTVRRNKIQCNILPGSIQILQFIVLLQQKL